MNPRPQALIASYHVPQPDLDSSSRRLHHFVDFFLDGGWDVAVAVTNVAEIERRARPLRQRGVPVYPLTEAEMQGLLEQQTFDVAILAFWHVAERLANLLRTKSPSTRILVDSMDLHFLRQSRRVFSAVLNDGSSAMLDEGFGLEAARELNVYAAADAVLTVSDKEAALVEDLVGEPGLAARIPDCETIERSPVPFEARRGKLIVGNFEHPPNVDAVRFLCEDVLPLVDPAVLTEHPVSVIGNGLAEAMTDYDPGSPWVRMIGWVPSLVPYLERSRISLLPLRFGAGTKRKLIQSMLAGTPAVSTRIGTEGFDVVDGRHVLVADDAPGFAAAIARLIEERRLWEGIASEAHDLTRASHGLEVGRKALMSVVDRTLSRPAKELVLPSLGGVSHAGAGGGNPDYRALARRLRRLMAETAPAGATVAVVSRGDPDLLPEPPLEGWHFPQIEDGRYAGHHPADDEAAIAHLEELRERGAEYLVIPATADWWLDHYAAFADHLASRCSTLVDRNGTGRIYALEAAPPRPPVSLPDAPELLLSVVIPTRDRAALLRESLASLGRQTLPQKRFEVIVVDDGSTDETAGVCHELAEHLPIRYERIEQSGIAVAKNTGIVLAQSPVLFFFDDDDVAHPDLLVEHVRAHVDHPEDEVAVLGHTTWAPSLEVTPLMHFVTDVGQYLFAYRGLTDRQELDFTYFWGGRTSCKRSLLERHGVFHPEFTFGCEDIELAYRLSKVGFRVVYRESARQYMNRTVTFDEFCRRCELQGRAQAIFSAMHDDAVVRAWCQTEGAPARWVEREGELERIVVAVHELENELMALDREEPPRHRLQELWSLYWKAFDTVKARGIARRLEEVGDREGAARIPSAAPLQGVRL